MKKITQSFSYGKKLLVLCLFLLSLSGNAQTFSLCLANGSSPTSTTFEVDVMLTVSSPIRLSSVAFGLNYNPAILNGGAPCTTANCGSWAMIAGTRSPEVAGLNPSTLTNRATPVGHLRATMTNLTGAASIDIAAGTYRIGRFRFTNTVDFVQNSNANVWIQPNNSGGSTNSIVSFYPFGQTTPIAAYTTTSLPAGGLTLCHTSASTFPIICNPGAVCATSGTPVVTPESCAGQNNGSVVITMDPVPTDLDISYVLDSGSPVTATLTAAGTFTLTGLSAGSHSVVVTGDGCATAVTVPFTVTANPLVTPTFTQVADICSGGTLNPLPTTSNNGITGSWSPVLDNTATTVYTFTPDAGQCASTATMTITVNTPTTPTFTQVAAICNGATLTALPTTSNNGITGTWAPALNNTATTTYTFTPDSGQCATTTTMTITVNQYPVTAAYTVCQGGTVTGGLTSTLDGGGAVEWYTTPTLGSAIGTGSPFNPVGVAGSGIADTNTVGSTTFYAQFPGTTCRTAAIFTVSPTTPNTTTITACDTYTWAVNGTTYTTSGTYTYVSGCNTETLNLTINNSTTGTTTATACDTYTWAGPLGNGNTYTTSQTGLTFVTTNAAGCPHTETLNLTINNSTSGTTTTTACDTYTWAAPLGNGLTYTTSQTGVTFVSTNAAGCPHTQTLNLTINSSTTGTTTTTACDSYTWAGPLGSGLTYTTNQTGISFVSTNAAGCPHTQTLNLTINNSTSATTTATACDTYTWAGPLGNGLTYTTSQTGLTFVTTNAAGCNHTQTLNLTINNSSAGTTTTTACDTYTWAAPLGNGLTYTTNQTGLTFVSTNAAGCNHTQTLNLTINSSTSGSTTTTACDSYTWAGPLGNGTTYTTNQAGLTFVSTNAAGCPHTQTLNLTINSSTTGTTTATACDTYTWATPLGNGITYTTSQTGVTNVTTNAAGCNHTQTLNLTINNSTSGTTTVTACDSYTWAGPLGNGQTYTTNQTGISFVSTNAAGCNHTQTLNLTITPSTTNGSVTTTACNSYTWPANGITYTTSQTNLTHVVGCNTATLNLTINTAATPTGSNSQSFNVTDLNDATIASLVVSPAGVIWYGSLTDAQNGTNPLPSTTVLTNGATYWAVNVVGTCASTPFAVTVTVTLGNDDFDNMHFTFYPNPTSSVLNISYSKVISEIQVTNLLGQSIMTKKTNETDVQVDLSSLAAATYFVKVSSEGNSKIIKVMKKD